MRAALSRTRIIWYSLLGVLLIMFGIHAIRGARADAARHIVRHGGYKEGYAPMYPWQWLAVGIIAVIIGAIFIFPAIQRFVLREYPTEPERHGAHPVADATNKT